MARHNYRDDIAGPAWLYRLFAGSALAYVGVTNDPRFRFTRHRQRTSWWPLIDRVDLKWFPSRADAFAAERAAIATDRPVYNVALPKGTI